MSREGFTVAELIEKLSQLEQDKLVWMELDCYAGTILDIREGSNGYVLKEFDWL